MPVRLSLKLRQVQLDNGVGSQFDAAVLEIRTGPQPASPNDAPTGTLLCSFTLPADAFGPADENGQISLLGVPLSDTADADGTMGWARFRKVGDPGTQDPTQVRLDGTVTAVGGGGMIVADNLDVVTGQQVELTAFQITQPAE
jgi:hypothetical protein